VDSNDITLYFCIYQRQSTLDCRYLNLLCDNLKKRKFLQLFSDTILGICYVFLVIHIIPLLHWYKSGDHFSRQNSSHMLDWTDEDLFLKETNQNSIMSLLPTTSFLINTSAKWYACCQLVIGARAADFAYDGKNLASLCQKVPIYILIWLCRNPVYFTIPPSLITQTPPNLACSLHLRNFRPLGLKILIKLTFR
jgi:hypothetical protein